MTKFKRVKKFRPKGEGYVPVLEEVPTLGDKPIEPEHREKMLAIANALNEFLNGDVKPRKIGFCVMVFNFGEGPGRANYISNAERTDVVVLLKEQLARFEGMPEQEGNA